MIQYIPDSTLIVRTAVSQSTHFLERTMSAKTEVSSVIPINRSKKFNPTKFTGERLMIEEQDERSLALTEVDLTSIRFELMLDQGETWVRGEKKLTRLEAAGHIRLDAWIFQTLWENQHLIPSSWKERTNGNRTFIYFDGTVLRGPDDRRFVLCLFWGDGQWNWQCPWLGCEWSVSDPSAVL